LLVLLRPYLGIYSATVGQYENWLLGAGVLLLVLGWWRSRRGYLLV